MTPAEDLFEDEITPMERLLLIYRRWPRHAEDYAVVFIRAQEARARNPDISRPARCPGYFKLALL